MTTKEKIIEAIAAIPDENLDKLLSLIEEFKETTVPVNDEGKWDRFFGILSDEEADAILAVIKETCERMC